jgi:hypothetical protein
MWQLMKIVRQEKVIENCEDKELRGQETLKFEMLGPFISHNLQYCKTLLIVLNRMREFPEQLYNFS